MRERGGRLWLLQNQECLFDFQSLSALRGFDGAAGFRAVAVDEESPDKPFAVGERVKIGAIDGSVESVGLRSTEVRSLDGNLFSVPNRQVADGVIENISRRPNIKDPFSIALTYDTPPEKMEEACKILHEILDIEYDGE